MFSNLDGTIQYVSLTETAGLDDQGIFKGLTLTITHAGVAKQFTFPDNLATFKTAHLTIVVAATPDVSFGPRISDNNGNFIVAATADFVAPARFVAADGGTIDFAGFDQVSYPALPADGSTAWYRDGTVAPGTLGGSYGFGLVPSSKCPGLINPTPTFVTAVEYYNAALDHYFLTAASAEIDALNSGRLAGWQRTGESLSVGEAPRTRFFLEYAYDGNPVCRFYLPASRGRLAFLLRVGGRVCGGARALPRVHRRGGCGFLCRDAEPPYPWCADLGGIDSTTCCGPSIGSGTSAPTAIIATPPALAIRDAIIATRMAAGRRRSARRRDVCLRSFAYEQTQRMAVRPRLFCDRDGRRRTVWTYGITELFCEDQDGSIQFIRLSETAGAQGQNGFQNLAITVTYPEARASGYSLMHCRRCRRRIATSSWPSPRVPVPELGEVPDDSRVQQLLRARCPSRLRQCRARFLPTDGATVIFSRGSTASRLRPCRRMARARSSATSAWVVLAVLPAGQCLGIPPGCPLFIYPTPRSSPPWILRRIRRPGPLLHHGVGTGHRCAEPGRFTAGGDG